MSTSIQKRGKRWTANVRLNGHSVSGTFDIKHQAAEWAGRVRREILAAHATGARFDQATVKIARRKLRPGDPMNPPEPTGPTQEMVDADPVPRLDWTLKRALRHYDDTVTENLKGWRQARARIKAWEKRSLAAVRMCDLTADQLTEWMEGRTKTKKVWTGKGKDRTVRVETHPVAASTVRNDLYRISVLYEHAVTPTTKKGWGLVGLKNPVADVAMPDMPEGRQARLEHDEQGGDLERILVAVDTGPDAALMRALVVLAVETGMRRSEILDLRAGQVRRTRGGHVVERPSSKSGARRRVILTETAAAAVLPLREGKEPDDKLIPLSDDHAAYRWDRARTLAKLPNLRMHDLRHEAMSSMADAGLSVGALAAQGGYKTMQTLLRYVNASERDIREKLSKTK